MKNVNVLLRENVQDLGHVGDIVAVAAGYARNYLLPRKLAIAATPDNIRAMERRRARWDEEHAKRAEDIERRIEALGRVKLATSQKADETGTLYGSVNAGMVAALLAEAGFEVDEKDVRLEEPIKATGTHEVPIHIHGERYGGVQLVVEAAG